MAGRPARAIVADDEEAIVFLISTILQSEGVDEVLTAADGDEALRLLESEGTSATLACVDVQMPGRGGLELVRAARAKGLALPFVVFSGHLDDSSLALAAGATEFLAKPFSTARFREVVRGLLSRDG